MIGFRWFQHFFFATIYLRFNGAPILKATTKWWPFYEEVNSFSRTCLTCLTCFQYGEWFLKSWTFQLWDSSWVPHFSPRNGRHFSRWNWWMFAARSQVSQVSTITTHFPLGKLGRMGRMTVMTNWISRWFPSQAWQAIACLGGGERTLCQTWLNVVATFKGIIRLKIWIWWFAKLESINGYNMLQYVTMMIMLFFA